MNNLRLKALKNMTKSGPEIDMTAPRQKEDLMGDKGMVSMAVTPEEKEMILAARAEKSEGAEDVAEEV